MERILQSRVAGLDDEPARGQISVLRALWKAPTPLTGRQVQQPAGVHNRTAMQCLEDLEQLGLLRRRDVGRAYLYSLRRSHRVVARKNLVEYE